MNTPLIFATNNQHKVDEIRAATGSQFLITTLKEAGINIDIPEPHDTLEENAAEKSATILQLTGNNCFSEDTGLEVTALNGAPGVKSARYAGEDKSFDKNVEKLLSEMIGKEDRSARFRTVISLRLDGTHHLFEGICEGAILNEPNGTGGFGYDPIFVPQGANCSFAQMTMEEKNMFSHRKKAVEQLVSFLNNYVKK